MTTTTTTTTTTATTTTTTAAAAAAAAAAATTRHRHRRRNTTHTTNRAHQQQNTCKIAHAHEHTRTRSTRSTRSNTQPRCFSTPDTSKIPISVHVWVLAQWSCESLGIIFRTSRHTVHRVTRIPKTYSTSCMSRVRLECPIFWCLHHRENLVFLNVLLSIRTIDWSSAVIHAHYCCLPTGAAEPDCWHCHCHSCTTESASRATSSKTTPLRRHCAAAAPPLRRHCAATAPPLRRHCAALCHK